MSVPSRHQRSWKISNVQGRVHENHWWLRKTTGFLIDAYGSAFWPVIHWVEDQDNATMNHALKQQFGPLGEEPVDDFQEKSGQVHVALLALKESESFENVLGAAPSGLEALRRLVRRWDPVSGGKRRALLRHILVPDGCKLQDLPAGLTKWVELVRRYERSKSSGTTAAALHEDMKTAALDALVPSELEQHLAMNHARLITYEQVPSEIQAYTEARRRQFAFKTVAAKNTSDPMDVDSCGEGRKRDGKNSKKGGKGQARVRIQIPARQLFVDTVVRKAT